MHRIVIGILVVWISLAGAMEMDSPVMNVDEIKDPFLYEIEMDVEGPLYEVVNNLTEKKIALEKEYEKIGQEILSFEQQEKDTEILRRNMLQEMDFVPHQNKKKKVRESDQKLLNRSKASSD